MPASSKRPGDDNAASRAPNSSPATFKGRDVHPDGVGSARKKQANSLSSRTGQACDRCKVRKIRCDARVGGCSPCLQNNIECRTTDRITGRATSRGHTEKIETENITLKLYIAELQQQLRDNGLEPKPKPAASGAISNTPPIQWAPEQGDPQGAVLEDGALSAETGHSQGLTTSSTLPGFKPGLIGDNYFGVGSDSRLSPIEGTSLSLFGMKIDLVDFIAPENQSNDSPSSYDTFLRFAFSRSAQVVRPSLPTYEDCRTYAQWYFRSVQQHLPILHKADIMGLITRIYKENYQPTAPETVMMHMMVSLTMFQYSMRNKNDQMRLESTQHYLYSLGFVPELIRGHKLEDIQALAMICQHLRCQPRAGAAWMFTNLVFGLAIELGLHRSAKAWPQAAAEHDAHTVEMRKRIFWSLLLMHTSIGGKLGRPMPLRVSDFDIEIPDPVSDNLPEEGPVSKWLECSFRAATETLKLTKISMQVWSTIYAIQSGAVSHAANIKHLENELQSFKAHIPPELSGGPQTRSEDQITACYIQLAEHEMRLLIHHPALCRSNSPKVISNSYDICLDAASRMLVVGTRLKVLQGLDTTWYYAADFVAAIFTTLFVHTERKDQMTPAAFERLKADMETWLDVMLEVGNLLGTGPQLAHAISLVIDRSLDGISRHLATKNESNPVVAALPSNQPADMNVLQQTRSQQSFPNTQSSFQSYGGGGGGGEGPADATLITSTNAPYHLGSTGQHTPAQQQPYHISGQFAFAMDPHQPMQQFAPGPVPAYDHGVYNTAEEIKPPPEVHLATHQAPLQPQLAASGYLSAYQASMPLQNGYGSSPLVTAPMSQSAAWKNFTDAIVTATPTDQAYIQPNSNIMGLAAGGNKVTDSVDLQAVIASMGMGNMQMGPGQQPWPLMHYNAETTGQGDPSQ